MIDWESIKKWLMPMREEIEVEDIIREVQFKKKNIVDECLDFWNKRRSIQ